ncbi:MAG: hypothetical protein KME04_05760 [Pleurocapsa minor GSE-CHR-MK-17-07R]|nr:hypothetical protein [Pleurocapsa minor GSE-CHR-MK 17-07R]
MTEPHENEQQLEEDYYPEDEPRRRGLGCWISGAVTLLCAVTLIAGGLFLPPVRLLDRLTAPAVTPVAGTDGSVSGNGISMRVLDLEAASDFGASFASAAADVTPASVRPAREIFAITTSGDEPERVSYALTVPLDSYPPALDVFAWNEGGQPVFLPSTLTGVVRTVASAPLYDYIGLFSAQPSSQPQVYSAIDVTQRLNEQVANAISIAAPAGLQPALDGSLTGSLAPGFDLSAPYRTIPVVRNYADVRATDPETVVALISDAGLRATHARQLASFASAGYDGVMLDYRDIPVAQRDNFSLLVEQVAVALENTGFLLGVSVPEPVYDPTTMTWTTGAYDWTRIGAAADLVHVRISADPALMSVEEGMVRFPNDPANGDSSIMVAMLDFATSQIQRSKLLIGLPALSQRETPDGLLTPIGLEQALSALGDVALDVQPQESNDPLVQPGEVFTARLDGYRGVQGRDDASGMPYIDYTDASGNAVARVWLSTPDAVLTRARIAADYAVAGIAFDDLAAPGVDPQVLLSLDEYRRGLPVEVADASFVLRWSVENAAGLREVIDTPLDQPLVATVSAGEGNYAVNVSVVRGNEPEAQREGAAVSVFLPTATFTPTPTPTATPTPLPTATPLPLPTAAPVSVSAAQVSAAGAPGAGSIVAGTIELGGHVASTQTNFTEAMRRAGMTWMKVQVRYYRGMSPAEAGNLVGEAQGRGFKILLGIVGVPAELRDGGTGYMQDFAGFLASVAGYGPDAIEVWNEPNLDREWPEGMISGTMYAEMLRLAYTAIKGTNSNVMVISGAPAPTGAEAAYPGKVMNDNTWIAQLVQAGGLQYMDCLGAHYNEGIVSPTQNGGDPRDNYYTRYFGGMLNTYWNLINGQRPICWTELGYLTPEGFPPLNEYFAWAQNVSLAQQAAWLAEAAALSSQSGRVRLLIVWNIDFTVYGSDPQAGYAIVRPGGGCPACDALAAAR